MTVTGGVGELPLVRAMGLHALSYCERLFYLEEVEEIRVADERVYAGRTLHLELEEDGDLVELTLESERLGVRGKMDAVRRRDGTLHPIEHKRGRAMRAMDNALVSWPSDRLQLTAYALLLEEHTGQPVPEGRIRYHADNYTVRIRINEEDRERLSRAVARARELAVVPDRPPITPDERRCIRCSLAPVCLPEEGRLALALDETPPPGEADAAAQEQVLAGASSAREVPTPVAPRRFHSCSRTGCGPAAEASWTDASPRARSPVQ